jgi:hypothetical protein
MEKMASAYGWQPYNFHLPIVLKSVSLNIQKLLWPEYALTWIAFLLPNKLYFTGWINEIIRAIGI